jgi:RNA polymerase sigma-70 factor (ECF subfamily)
MSLDLRRLYDEHASSLYAFLLNLSRSESETRDLLQDHFVKLATKSASLEAVRDVRAWLVRLAHHLFIDACRRRTSNSRMIERVAADSTPLFEPSNDLDEQSFRGALANALGELPAEQGAVVHLKLWEEMTFAQIAEALEISPNTAASRYRYGLDKLQTLLRPLYEELS